MSFVEISVIPLVNKHLIELSKEVRDYGDYWSASSAGYCMRLNIMRRLKVPVVPEMVDSEGIRQRVFTAGHIFHGWIQGVTKEAGLSIAQELELQDEDLMIRGHIDDLLKMDDKLVLYDYKTQNSMAFTWQKGRPLSHYHKMQLGTYMYMLRKNTKHDVSEARVCKISKDDLRMTEDQLFWSPDLEREVIGYWRTINGYWEKKAMPKCTCLDIEGGFMGKRSSKGKVYNDYFYEDEPCSMKWYEKMRAEGKLG